MSLSMIEGKRAALLAQCPPAPSLSDAEAAGLPIHVERFGTTGAPLLIVHGGMQGGVGGGPATFARQQALAERGWQVAVVDRPGFGQSPSRGVDDMAAEAAWIAGMLDGDVSLLGHSWGGATALLAAARRPDAVRCLILVEPALHALAMVDPEIQGDPVRRAAMAQALEPLLMAQTPADYARAFVRSLGATGAGTARNIGDLDTETAGRLGCSMLQARPASPPMLRQAAETIAEAKIPVLVIGGGWSATIEAVADAAARATGGRYVRVSSPNHFPQLENPDEFNAVVDGFMRENAHSSGS